MIAARVLTIDPEFDSLCPALTPEEFNLLEMSVQADGCRDAIVVWANHDDLILDGHTRYRICKQSDRPFKTKAITLASREDAINWIIANQLGRRNLTENQKTILWGKRYLSEKNAEGAPPNDIELGQNAPVRTSAKLAAEYNVNERTIRRDADFAGCFKVRYIYRTFCG